MQEMRNASLGKRQLAIIYDSLIVFLIVIVTNVVIAMIVSQGKELPADHFIFTILKSFWFILSFLYFAYYWTKRGQTPGMKVWKIKAINQDGDLISWSQSITRYLSALFGLGLLAIPFNKQKLALQDIVSKTKLVFNNE